jgi:hypothetical protein
MPVLLSRTPRKERLFSVTLNQKSNDMSDKGHSYRENNRNENGWVFNELDALVDTLYYVASGASQYVNDQLEIGKWGPALDNNDDDATARTNPHADTVFTDDSTLYNSIRTRRAVDLIKDHASRLGVSGAELLKHPSLLQGARNQQKEGAGSFDDDSSEEWDDSTLGSYLDDDTFLSYFDDNTTINTILDDGTLYTQSTTGTLLTDKSAKTLLAKDCFEGSSTKVRRSSAFK